MFARTLQNVLMDRLKSYSVVFLTGPRQSGKTTLARTACPDFVYHSLENLQIRQEATEDPLGFLGRFEKSGTGVILDEVQRVPSLFSYLQQIVDERRAGPFVLTGSQHFLLSDQIAQSLAGRATILELLPFSMAEREQRTALTPRDFENFITPPCTQSQLSLEQIMFAGFFPRVLDQQLDPNVWLDDYVRTYVERDVRLIGNIGNLDQFSTFLRLCAGRSGQILDTASLGSDAGISHTTVRQWLSILRASYIIEPISPHHENFNKRIIKSPKLYFVDTGLLCYLLGIRTSGELLSHPLRGQIFENLVFTELRKVYLHAGERPPLYFWRDSNGREVDFLIDTGHSKIPIEAKAGKTIASDFFKHLDTYLSLSGDKAGMLVYGGDERYQRRNHQIRPWWALS